MKGFADFQAIKKQNHQMDKNTLSIEESRDSGSQLYNNFRTFVADISEWPWTFFSTIFPGTNATILTHLKYNCTLTKHLFFM